MPMPSVSPTENLSTQVDAPDTTGIHDAIIEATKPAVYVPIAISLLGFLLNLAYAELRMRKKIGNQRVWDLASQYSTQVDSIETKACEYWTTKGNNGSHSLVTEMAGLSGRISNTLVPSLPMFKFLKWGYRKSALVKELNLCIVELRKAITGPDGFADAKRKAAKENSALIREIHERGENLRQALHATLPK